VFVLTERLDRDVSDPGITLLSVGVTEGCPPPWRAAEGKKVGILGANVARQCLAAGLVDELQDALHGEGAGR
jgi:hypothetical protein